MSDKTEEVDKKERAENAPRDEGTIHVSEFIKITDPETGEILLNKRDS